MPFVTDETDLELYIITDLPTFIIEIYVGSDQKYSLSAEWIDISNIRRQFDKQHGVSQIADVTITFRNGDNQFNETNPDSIFYNQQVIGNWIRIKSGWGPEWSNNIESQFQGKIKLLETSNKWQARMVCYDALKDLQDPSVGSGGLTIDSTVVSSMNPIDVLEYLIDTEFALTWFNMDSLTSSSLLEPTALGTARTATEGLQLGATTWPEGSRGLDIVADIMKMIGGYLYSGKDGRLYPYLFAPSQTSTSELSGYSFIGDVTQKEPRILDSKRELDANNIINQVAWKYGQGDTEHVSEADSGSVSVSRYGIKTLSLSTGWELYNDDTEILDIVAQRMIARFAEPIPVYPLRMSWLRDGDALAMDLGDIVEITDPALNISTGNVQLQRMNMAVDKQYTDMVLYNADALLGKYWFWSSEIDQRDGYGITATNFDTNWLLRFGFFSMPDTHFNPAFDNDGNRNGRVDPGYGAQDAWGNGIEEHFIDW